MNIPPNVNLKDYIKIVGESEAQEIHTAGYWREQLLERSNGIKVTGDKLPWGKVQENFRLRPNELTIWGGMNGHRKSMVLGMVALSLALQGKKVAIASLEMKPEETLWRMCLQASGSKTANPPKEFIEKFTDFADENILIYDQLDSVPTEKVLGFANYCGSELGVSHIIIDSLAKCGIGVENREGEADFINNLAWSAKHLGTHIHLVSHVRKPQSAGEEYVPNKFDVKGTSALVDLADNLVIVWADKKRERLKQLDNLDEKQQEYFDNSFDQKLIVAKQRHGHWEGTIGLYSHNSLQFTAIEGRAIGFGIENLNKTVDNENMIPDNEVSKEETNELF